VSAGYLIASKQTEDHTWTKTFTDPRLHGAIIDRLTFAGNIIEPAPSPTAWLTPRAARATR
jgi:hypothetical protein